MHLLFALWLSFHAHAQYYGYGYYGQNALQSRLCGIYLTGQRQVQAAQVVHQYLRTSQPYSVRPMGVAGPTDYAFLKSEKERSTRGNFHSLRDPRLNTMVHFSLATPPRGLQVAPLLDEQTRGLVIYLPGAGTQGVGGEAFGYQANVLAQLGIAAVSLNYPFHKDGPRDQGFYSSAAFIQWLQNFIYLVRSGYPQVPVVLAGHSMGANLVLELATWDPYLSNRVLALSPASIDANTEYWNANFTPRAVLRDREFRLNREGAQWVYQLSSQMQFKTTIYTGRNFPDPTQMNPALKLRVVWGENDIFIPGPYAADGTPTEGPRTYDLTAVLRQYFSRVDTWQVPGADHRLMSFKDANGQSLAIREIMEALGLDPDREKELRREYGASEREKVAQAGRRYYSDPYFRQWIAEGRTDELNRVLKDQDANGAQQLLRDYEAVLRARREGILERIKETETTAPEFFAANRDDIAQIGQKNFPVTRLLNRYLEFMDQNPQYRR